MLDEIIIQARKHHPKEIIIVDAHSTDNTVKIAERHGCKICYDEGFGLGNARNIGLKNATGEYVLYIGPDNILKPTPNITTLIKTMDRNKWAGVGLKSRVLYPSNYFDKGMDHRWQYKLTAGEKNAIGTPFMFKRSLLNKYKFNETLKASDDTELCERIRKSGKKVGYSNIECWECSDNSYESIKKRFMIYGRSDGEFYLKHYRKWNTKRRIKSLLHPLSEFSIIKKINDIIYVPFVLLIVLFRYIGYVNKLRNFK